MKKLLSLLFIIAFNYAMAQQVTADLQAPVQYVDSNTNLFSKVESYDGDLDGIPDYIGTYIYDANGNEISFTGDNNGDGNPNSIYLHTYDENGNLLSSSEDSDGDGIPEEINTYTYNANGNQLTYTKDSDGDGNPDRITTYTYDANGNRLTYSYDSDGDGTPEEITTYTYDANGNELSYSRDTDNDGIPNSIGTYTYDVDGNLLSYSIDSNGDGIADDMRTYTYDANGNRLTFTYDSNADGSPNEIRTYTFDANGNETSYIYDGNGDGIPESITLNTYDANGNEIYYSYDNNGDGNSNFSRTSTYNAAGHLTLIVYAEDGVSVESTAYTYDAFGNLISESEDSNFDGNFDEIYTYTYEYFKSCANITGISNKMYKVNIPETGTWTFSTCSDVTDFDTKLIVGSTACASDLGEDADFCTGGKAELTLNFAAAQDVYVIVAGEDDELGTFELRVSKEVTSIANLDNNSVSVFPNPTNGLLNIKMEDNAVVNYQIFNINGQLVQKGILKSVQQIDVKDLTNGFYTISIKQKNKVYQAKFVVDK